MQEIDNMKNMPAEQADDKKMKRSKGKVKFRLCHVTETDFLYSEGVRPYISRKDLAK